MSNLNLTKKIRHFVQYHNAFILIMIFIIGFGSAIFASPDLRENVVGQKIVEEYGKDNSFLLSIDLDEYDLAMEITDILEDDNYYYVHYRHKAIVIENGVWQETIKKDILRVEKESDRYDDLGLYIAEKLSQVASHWVRVLKTAQKEAQKEGLTQRTETTRYSGIVGRFVDVKERKIPGYEPVLPVEEERPEKPVRITREEPIDYFEPDFRREDSIVRETIEQEELTEQERLRKLIKQILAEKYGIVDDMPSDDEDSFDSSMPSATPPVDDADTPIEPKDPDADDLDKEPQAVCDSENLNLCTTQTECENTTGYWYNQTCNTEPDLEPEPEPEPESEPEPEPEPEPDPEE